MTPREITNFWMTQVIRKSTENGRITATEIQAVAEAHGVSAVAADLVTRLRCCKKVSVEVIGKEPNGKNNYKRRIYRVTLNP